MGDRLRSFRWDFIPLICFLLILPLHVHTQTPDELAAEYLKELEVTYSKACNTQMEKRWAYITDITEENQAAMETANADYLQFQSQVQRNISQFNEKEITNADVLRQIKYLRLQGPGNVSSETMKNYTSLAASMETTYSSATVCKYDPNADTPPDPNTCQRIPLEPDIEGVIASSQDYYELLHYWVGWRNESGRKIRDDYITFVDYSNQMAVGAGQPNTAELWLEFYETEDFEAVLEGLWNQVLPLYKKLHTYVRMKLNEKYGGDKVKRYGYLPAHLLGNMWAQDWTNIESFTRPFPDVAPFDVTDALVEQGYDVRKMFDLSDTFFQDLSFNPMTQTFWDKSMLEKPDGKEVVCHASAEDFCLGKDSEDFRIKMCTTVNMEDLITIHHEMGHIQYFMEYKGQPFIYRTSANPGFHEAVGDTVALSVMSAKHLTELGLLETNTDDKNATINFLYRMALEKVAFLPFALVMDKWRLQIFRGDIPDDRLNTEWWNLRKSIQGVTAPVTRTEEDFDPGAKYHIPTNVEYMRYFVSYIVQFQFYEAMCIAAGQYDPNNPDSLLHQCDFNKNTEAGNKLKQMLQLGLSKAWPEALNTMTGNSDLSANSLLNYFKPLSEFLDASIPKSECIGWAGDCVDHANEFLRTTYEGEASIQCHDYGIADWNYNVNLTSTEAVDNLNSQSLIYAQYNLDIWKNFTTQYDWEDFPDSDPTAASVKREFRYMAAIGTSALDQESLKELSDVQNSMTSTYSTAKICPFNKQTCNLETEGLLLDPDLEDTMATSRDYAELQYVWEHWRDASGRLMKTDYEKWVEYQNKAAVLNGYSDMSELWLMSYESDTIRDDFETIWEEIRPLYRQIHAYVRHKLSLKYGEDKVHPEKPIPAHILGNMWAQQWDNIFDIVIPYPDEPAINVTAELVAQNYTAEDLFKKSEDFYVSMGLLEMPTCYGDKAMIERPDDGREVVCHASAWDFCDKTDYRIKMCTNINMEDFITIHHEMGHIQYDEQYKDLPITFRQGANEGFHEAIGDVIALSVDNPKHLEKIDLLHDYTYSEFGDLNSLMNMALQKIVFLPYAYTIDKFRWDIFEGNVNNSVWTRHYWSLRESLQGLSPPVTRSEKDFDPGAKFHVPSGTPYIRYFVAHIVQFQFHKALCQAAGEYVEGDPDKALHKCDIYGNTDAGTLYADMLKMGISKPWPEAMQTITGSPTMSASAMLEYFEPLRAYLEKYNADNQVIVGWTSEYENLIVDEDIPKKPEPANQTVPIVVGCIILAVDVALVAFFLVKNKRGST